MEQIRRRGAMATDTGLVARRMRALKAEMEKEHIDCYIVVLPSTVYYLTGYRESGDAPLLLIIPLDSEPLLLVHRMNYQMIREYAQGCTLIAVRTGGELFKKTVAEINERKIKALYFDELLASWYESFKTTSREVTLEQRSDVIWRLRSVKDAFELQLLKRAAHLSGAGMDAAIKALRVGVKEYEVAAEAEYAMRRRGSEGVAFETIVASGRRSAWPHGLCGDRRLEEGDAVLIDLGAMYAGYRSDVSRTAFVGRPSPDQIAIYRAVYTAQQEVLSKMEAGMRGGEIDALARRILRKQGYARYMLHGIGHGVGLDIHEPPRLGINSSDQLEEGNVVTVEPGVYISGRFGVRIEDTIALCKDGLEVLTQCEKTAY